MMPGAPAPPVCAPGLPPPNRIIHGRAIVPAAKLLKNVFRFIFIYSSGFFAAKKYFKKKNVQGRGGKIKQKTKITHDGTAKAVMIPPQHDLPFCQDVNLHGDTKKSRLYYTPPLFSQYKNI
jgi:hypothetical protein